MTTVPPPDLRPTAPSAAPGCEIADPRRAILARRRAVLALQEELERRDVEQMELEGAIEHLLSRESVQTYALGRVIRATFGDQPGRYGGDEMMATLYGPRNEYGFRAAPIVTWRRPRRRWAQFGSRREHGREGRPPHVA